MIKHNTFEINSFLDSLNKMESEAINHAEFLKKGRRAIEANLAELSKIFGKLNLFINFNPYQPPSKQDNITEIKVNSECADQKLNEIKERSKTLESVVISKNEPGRNERVLSVFEPGKELTFPEIRDALIQKGIVWSDDEENRVRACLGKLANDNGPLGTRKIDKIRKVWFLKTSNNL
jgi:hypothetical protein